MGYTNYTALAIRLKNQLNDVIDIAYANSEPETIRQYKNFTISCHEEKLKTRLADCHWNRGIRKSAIRIFQLDTRYYKHFIITGLHEVAHHIDHSIRDCSGHDKAFYSILETLIHASLNMGLIDPDYLLHNDSTSRSKNKVANMLKTYEPNPVPYKQDAVQVFVYNSFMVKDALKDRGYKWNAVEKAWSREVTITDQEEEKAFLLRLKIKEDDVKIVEDKGMIVRLRKVVALYNVPYEQRDIPKKLGYHWHSNKKEKCWRKQIEGDQLSDEERHQLISLIPDVRIRVV